MGFPTVPSIDLPLWAYGGGAVLTEPPGAQKSTGWTAVPGQNYGQIPPYQWQNWLNNSTGQWLNYANTALAYINTTGVPQWSASTTYNSGSIVQDGTGYLYRSLANSNLNNVLTNGSYWTSIGVPTGFSVGNGSQVGLVSANIINLSTANINDGVLFSMITAPSSGGGSVSVDMVHYKDGDFNLNNNDIAGTINFAVNPAGAGVTPAIQIANSGFVNLPIGGSINGHPMITKVNTQRFTYTGSTQTYIPSTGMVWCEIIATAGGGGAAGGSGNSEYSFGSGGGAGGTQVLIASSATIGGSQSINIGAAGTGGQASATSGGNTSVGSLITASGGYPGVQTNFTSSGGFFATGGIGNSGTGGTSFYGAHGATGYGISSWGTVGGNGGSSYWGSGGIGSFALTNGSAGTSAQSPQGTAYGAAGGGGASYQSASGNPGANAANGYVQITEFISA